MKKYLALAVCVVLGGCSTIEWAEIRSLVRVGDEVAMTNTEQALAQGREQFAHGNYGIAVDSFNAAATFDPQSIRALNGLAASYDKLGRFDLAERYYASALEIDPQSPVTLNNAGYSQLLQGNLKKALKLFELAASYGPDNALIAANTELAVNMMGYDTRRAPDEDAAVVELAQAPTPTKWIEKTAERVHTLVTRPDPAFLERAEQLQVNPRLVSLNGVRQQ
jgi:Flp pilus assembly protein TadD